MSYNFSGRIETIKEVFSSQKWPGSDWQNIFSWEYWTDRNITSDSPYYLVTLVLVLLTIVGILLWRRQAKLLHQIAPIYDKVINSLTNAIVFIVVMTISYLFFRYQEIDNLSSRLVVLASIAVALVYLVYAAYIQLRVIPSKRQEYLEKERFFRYLPKKKEKK